MLYLLVICQLLVIISNCKPLFLDDTTCSCLVGDLEYIEKLNTLNFRRLRIQYRNGINKYPLTLGPMDYVECYSMAVYERTLDPSSGKVEKLCRQCVFNSTDSYWSNLNTCLVNYCDKDALIGNPTLVLDYSRTPMSNQQLFESGKVQAIYKYGQDRRCKLCQIDGEWSKYAEDYLCSNELTTLNPNIFCRLSILRELDSQKPQYLRLRVESSTGLFKYSQEQTQFPVNSIAVYQTYEFNFNETTTATITKTSTNKYLQPMLTSIRKYCRYCDDGDWSNLEECVSLKCDKDSLTGDPDLYFFDKNNRPPTQQTLFSPFSIIAASTFGGQKFCKQCHENGEWSRYSVSELCTLKLKPPLGYVPNKQRQPKNNAISTTSTIPSQLSLNEQYCTLNELSTLEDNSYKRLSVETINSTLIATYLKLSNTQNDTQKWCRYCSNGAWSVSYTNCPIGSNANCDPNDVSLRTASYFVYTSNGSKLNDKDKQNKLFIPGELIAVYEFISSDRYCKECETNGQWSRYQDKRICDKVKWS